MLQWKWKILEHSTPSMDILSPVADIMDPLTSCLMSLWDVARGWCDLWPAESEPTADLSREFWAAIPTGQDCSCLWQRGMIRVAKQHVPSRHAAKLYNTRSHLNKSPSSDSLQPNLWCISRITVKTWKHTGIKLFLIKTDQPVKRWKWAFTGLCEVGRDSSTSTQHWGVLLSSKLLLYI